MDGDQVLYAFYKDWEFTVPWGYRHSLKGLSGKVASTA